MTAPDFEAICKLVRTHSAIVLKAGQEYLVEARLAPLVRQCNLSSIGDLVGMLRRDPGNGLSRQIIEAMVTTESSFFRDHHPFEALRQTVLPDLIRRRRHVRRLRIWCAACSTGQEPYSVAMLLQEHFPELATWQLSLTASDVSRTVLERARLGRFNQIEVNRGLPASLLVKYFEQHGTDWQLSAQVRSMVSFQEMNLSHVWPAVPQTDLVMIRNVMIYFDVETKKQILGKVSRILQPDGYLLLGGAETTYNLSDNFRRIEPLKSGYYQLANAE